MEYLGVKIEYLGHACFRIEGKGMVIYVDPFKIKSELKDGDVVICTHDHFDHCSIEDVLKVAKDDAVIVASVNCKEKLESLKQDKVLLKPGEKKEIKSLLIEAVPAYNIDKQYHPKEYNGIGVIVNINKVRIYHAGDTDFIPEMKALDNIDIALLPVSGVYVMDAEQAIEAAKAIKPKIAIPMHYGVIVGSRNDAERFMENLKNVCEVKILK